ncbi:hypothetical protein OKW46_001914 [Paraburkholderia sp. WSM4179]|nr:hypothetical protein [Paraburkholderia sp. WSM4179]
MRSIVIPHLAAYAGLAPVTRRSGSSIRGEYPSRRGNKVLKRALFLSAFAALRDPRDYYARKVQQGKRHNQALIALARLRCDVLFVKARACNPARWSCHTRNWTPVGAVTLNPERDPVVEMASIGANKQPLAA